MGQGGLLPQGADRIHAKRNAGVRHDSPLRYPGGKAALAPFLAETIALNGLAGCSYFEPFAGGAGAAFNRLPLKYDLQRAREAQELLIAPNHVRLPEPHEETTHAWITAHEH